MLTVASVNVNGIRAAFRRGMGDWLAWRRPDVLALQEVRAGDEHLAEHLGPEWHVAHEAGDVAGRAGVAVAARVPVTGVRVGLGLPDEPTAAGRWVEADVHVPGAPAVTVVSVYVPKGEAGDEARMAAKYAFLDALTRRLGELGDGRAAVVAGDLNIAHRPADLRNAVGNRSSAGFLPRERAYLDRWTSAGWVDVVRALAGDVAGPYTWWSWRGRAYDNDAGWRIDYQLASTAIAGSARTAAVDRAATYAARFSDHAPVVVGYDV